MSKAKHTPGRIEHGTFYYPDNGEIGSCEIRQEGEFAILAKIALPVADRSGHKEGQANVRRFVTCWNSHDDLLEAHKDCKDHIEFAINELQSLTRIGAVSIALDSLNEALGLTEFAIAKAEK